MTFMDEMRASVPRVLLAAVEETMKWLLMLCDSWQCMEYGTYSVIGNIFAFELGPSNDTNFDSDYYA